MRQTKAVEDSFQAFLVNEAHFTGVEEYPIIPRDMISRHTPKKIIPFSKAINYQGNLEDTFICTYSPDKTFERIKRAPVRYVNFFRRTAGLIGFDFSVHSNMPVVKQKGIMFDNLALTYYYGSRGIPIIPNLRCGIDELFPEFAEAIPKKSLVAIGTHGFCDTVREQCEWYCFIERVISLLQPSEIVVYGSLRGKIFDDFKNIQKFVFFTPWINAHRKGVR